jgi:CRP-like cAMP-binding protein
VTRDPCPDELRSLELFGGLRAAQLQLLCAWGRVEEMPAGPLVHEGHAASHLYVMLDGEVVVCKRAGHDDVEIERTTRRGLAFGALSAYTGTEDRHYDCSVRLTRPSRLFILAAADFAQFMTTECPMAVELINGYLTEHMQQRRILGQRNALIAMGEQTSGLARQLNRPAAVIAGAISHLRDTFSTTGQDLVPLLECRLTPGALHLLFSFEDEVVEHIAKTHAQTKQTDGQAYDNAIRDMNGRGTLTLRTTLDSDAMIRVEVGDDGPGIPHDITHRTLVRSFTTRGVGGGAGLGLDQARRIVVDRHHGILTVESVPGDTRVIVRLPVRAPAPNHIESTVLELPGARAHEAGRGPPGVVGGNQPGRR